MSDDFVRVSRRLLADTQFRGICDVHAALWLVLHASLEAGWVDVKGRKVHLKPGQLACVPADLAAAWGTTEPLAVRKILHFVAMGFIKLSQAGEVGIITICKYAEYPPNDQEIDRAQQLFTQLDDFPPPPDKSPTINELFELWYSRYPHKVCRGQAVKAFPSALKKAGSLGVLLDGLQRYIKTKPKDRPWANPATWLRGERWLDEEATPEKPDPSAPRRLRYAI